MVKAFAQASAEKIILVGRRLNLLDDVKADLETEFNTCNFVTRNADVSNEADVDRLFVGLKAENVEVDVLVNNAGVNADKNLIKESNVEAWWKNYVRTLVSHKHQGTLLMNPAPLGNHAQRSTDHDSRIPPRSNVDSSSQRDHDLFDRLVQSRPWHEQLHDCQGRIEPSYRVYCGRR